MNHYHHLDIELREDMDKRFEQINQRSEQDDKRFEQVYQSLERVQEEIKRIYKAINGQTWKMIGAVGLIVLLGKLIENFGG